jgi:CRP-like cAMP-binding protein
MVSVHLKKLRKHVTLNAQEEQIVRSLVSEVRKFAPDQVAVRAGEPLNSSMMLLSGWMARVKDLPSGERQVTELHVAGDFTDIHSFTLKCLDHDVVTMSECSVGIVPHERIREMTETHPRLGRIYWFLTNLDAAIQREWALSLGQRSAISRMAHLFCEMYERLQVVGLASGQRYDIPLTQRELSECLGLTVVHANRTIQELRRRGLIELENRVLIIRDRKALDHVAQFDDSYLYLDKREF